MARVIVIDRNNDLAERVITRLRQRSAVEACQHAPALNGGYGNLFEAQSFDTVVYSPPVRAPQRMTPALGDAEALFALCARAKIKHVIVMSSAAVYTASPHNPRLMSESHLLSRNGNNPIGGEWIALEALAEKYLGPQSEMTLTILRPAAVLVAGGADYFSRLFGGRLAMTLPRYDPSLQLLSLDDLANAVSCAVMKSQGGIYNVAPDDVIPLWAALHLAGVKRVPIARTLQKLTHDAEQLEYIRYAWTVSNTKIKRELGFAPGQSSAQALADFHANGASNGRWHEGDQLEFDDFGMDTKYIDKWRRRLFHFLHDRYWRVEVKGLENVPRVGRAVLTGLHRGFMPFDGTMILHLIAQKLGRYVRTLIHPTLIKTPFPFNFEKLGGIGACRENADLVLQRDQLLVFFPEGIDGAFRYYHSVYKLGKFGRDEYVKTALRNQAPIIPFVTVGSAEIFPIIAKFHWSWWRRLTAWPCFPIAPPFPLLPVPFPTKWHTQFLEPIHVEKQYPPEAADDLATVQAISRDVKNRMQQAMDDMRRRRKSIFFGSIFE